MRVVAAEQVVHQTPARVNRALNIEFVGLALVTMVVLFGIALTYGAKVARLSEVAPPNGVIPLYALKSAADLDPALTMIEPESRRKAVARAVFARPASPLGRVGALV